MPISLLSSLLLVGCGMAIGGIVRRVRSSGAPLAGKPADVTKTVAVVPPAKLAADAPQSEPSPTPPLPAERVLDRKEVFRRVRELELGALELERPLPQYDRALDAALVAISAAAVQRRYAPRRPNLLPQVMHAINDEDVSRRKLAAMIARDPALVGSLLKMANSSFYRVTSQPVENIERAVVILGTDGLRSLMAAAVMQPIFQVSGAGPFSRFPEIVWDHALRSAHAAIPHAALAERADPFAAELLSLVSGLAEVVVFRAAMDHWASSSPPHRPDPAVMAALLDSQSAMFAWQIGADWELSDLMLAALEEQMMTSDPKTPLGRSLHFARLAGALAVLYSNSVIDDATVRISLPEAGLSPSHLRQMWIRLLREHEDPRAVAK
ncbi:MAG TPA: HDOD domain-containing protein [Steroidobacteraceae bacterium]|nr:HDOD domain-containing protein [Steroidobacteraceae bacterium]